MKTKPNPTPRSISLKEFATPIGRLAKHDSSTANLGKQFLDSIYRINRMRFIVGNKNVPYRSDIYLFLLQLHKFRCLMSMLIHSDLILPFPMIFDLLYLNGTDRYNETISYSRSTAKLNNVDPDKRIEFLLDAVSQLRKVLSFFKLKYPTSELEKVSRLEDYRMDTIFDKWENTVSSCSYNVFISKLEEDINHAIGMADLYGHKFITYRVTDKTINQVRSDFDLFESNYQTEMNAELKKGGSRYVTRQQLDWGETVINYNNGLLWEKLPHYYSEKERLAGGHCGNAPGSVTDSFYSLRQEHPKKKGVYKVCISSVIDNAGIVKESKAVGNSHPREEFYKPFVDLIVWHNTNKRSIIDYSGDRGWLPTNNIHFRELSPELRDYLTDNIPQGVEKFDYIAAKVGGLKKDENGYFWESGRSEVVSSGITKGNQAWCSFLIKHKLFNRLDLADVEAGYGFDKAIETWETLLGKDPSKLRKMFSQAKEFKDKYIRIFSHEVPVDKEFIRRFAWAMTPRQLVIMVPHMTSDETKAVFFAIDSIIEAEKIQINFDSLQDRHKQTFRDDFWWPSEYDYSYDFNYRGELKKINHRYGGGKDKQKVKAKAEFLALENIQVFLDEIKPSPKVLSIVIGKIPKLKIPKYIVKAYPKEKALGVLLENLPTQSKKKILRKGKQYLYMVEEASSLEKLMDYLKNGLDKYSEIIEQGMIDVYYDIPSRPKEIESYLESVIWELKRNHKPYYELNKEKLEEAQALVKLVIDDEDLTKEQEEEYERIKQVVTDSQFSGHEVGAYDGFYKEVIDYIEDIGPLVIDTKYKLYIETDNLLSLLADFINDEHSDFDDYINDHYQDQAIKRDFKPRDHDSFSDEAMVERFKDEF